MSKDGPKAPRPGVGARNEAAEAASRVIAIRIKDETRKLGVGSVPMRTRAVLDDRMGLSFEECLIALNEGLKIHAVFGVWFVAGHSADSTLSYDKDEAAFNALLPTLGEGDISVEFVEPSADSPEA